MQAIFRQSETGRFNISSNAEKEMKSSANLGSVQEKLFLIFFHPADARGIT